MNENKQMQKTDLARTQLNLQFHEKTFLAEKLNNPESEQEDTKINFEESEITSETPKDQNEVPHSNSKELEKQEEPISTHYEISWGEVTIWDETSTRHSPPPQHVSPLSFTPTHIDTILKKPSRRWIYSDLSAGFVMILLVIFLATTVFLAYLSYRKEDDNAEEIEWGDQETKL